jgi:hypothetical protein
MLFLAVRIIGMRYKTIMELLMDSELKYPDGQRFTWSRRTVLAYLGRLERSGIATASGLSHYHGTRRRALHSDRLLFVPLESCTSTPLQSCTRIKSLLKVHRNVSATELRKSPSSAVDGEVCPNDVGRVI